MGIMFENIMNFFKKWNKKENKAVNHSKEAAKERLHLVLMQDRANVSADFLELMKQEIIEVIKKYIDVDESAIDVRLTNKENGDGTNGAPALYANIPILNIKNEARKVEGKRKETKKEEQARQNEKEDTQKKETKEEIQNQEVKRDKKKEVENKTQEIADEVVQKEAKTVEKEDDKAKEKIKSEN